jgi:hypothetical protein
MTTMKKLLSILAVLVLTMSMAVMADNDRVITFDKLPQAAQTLLKANFANKVPVAVTADRDDYMVIYQSGEKVEFDKKGNWKELNCKTSSVPAALIPAQITNHVNATFPGATIVKIERDRRGYEVKLNNGMDIEYNKQFKVTEIGD